MTKRILVKSNADLEGLKASPGLVKAFEEKLKELDSWDHARWAKEIGISEEELWGTTSETDSKEKS